MNDRGHTDQVVLKTDVQMRFYPNFNVMSYEHRNLLVKKIVK